MTHDNSGNDPWLRLTHAMEDLRDALVRASLTLKDMQLELESDKRKEAARDCDELIEKAKTR